MSTRSILLCLLLGFILLCNASAIQLSRQRFSQSYLRPPQLLNSQEYLPAGEQSEQVMIERARKAHKAKVLSKVEVEKARTALAQEVYETLKRLDVDQSAQNQGNQKSRFLDESLLEGSGNTDWNKVGTALSSQFFDKLASELGGGAAEYEGENAGAIAATEIGAENLQDVPFTPGAEPTEEQIAEANSETASEASAEIPAEGPAEVPAEIPVEGPAEAPAEIPAEVPAEIPVEGPAEAPAEIPAETPVQIPEEASAETPATPPAETPAQTPAETPAETPATPPAETPAQTPAETPAETPATPPAETPAEVPAEAAAA